MVRALSVKWGVEARMYPVKEGEIRDNSYHRTFSRSFTFITFFGTLSMNLRSDNTIQSNYSGLLLLQIAFLLKTTIS